MLDIILDSLLDTVKLIPFLLLTYIAMEYLEHRAGAAAIRLVRRAGKWGPVIGAGVGVVPQCGFSAAASSLYAGRVISLGTLLAIYLSTSDEMLPILISAHASPVLIAQILGFKIAVGLVAGFCVDLLFRRELKEHEHIHELCAHDHCGCEKGILKSALLHVADRGICFGSKSVPEYRAGAGGRGGLEPVAVEQAGRRTVIVRCRRTDTQLCILRGDHAAIPGGSHEFWRYDQRPAGQHRCWLVGSVSGESP